MFKLLTVSIVVFFCATGVNAKSPKFTDQELQKAAPCLAEIDRAAKSAQDAAAFDANGSSRKSTGKFVPHDHSKCEDWDDYVRKNYPNPSGN